METLKEILSPDFLLRNSVYTSVLIGFACPLVGVFLVLRRLVFMGVALPQISSTGVAVALSVPLWLGLLSPAHAAHSEHLIAFAGSMIFSLVAILLLAFCERRGRGLPEGRLGTLYVVSSAASILLLAKNRYAEVGWLDLLKGEIIAIDNSDLVLTAVTLAVVLTLLVPALTAHLFARTMRQFFTLASIFGGVLAFLGFWLAYQWDWPVGPTDVVLLGLIYALAWAAQRVVQAVATK